MGNQTTLWVIEGIDDHDAEGRHWSRPVPRPATRDELVVALENLVAAGELPGAALLAAVSQIDGTEPDYEAAAQVLADNDGIEIIEWHEELSRRVVVAALAGRLVIPVGEEPNHELD